MTDKILIVDDEMPLLKACRRMLRNEPYECVTFSSPLEALEMVSCINPAVVISDQRMPEMSGVEFLGKIREIIPSAVRILTTGYADVNATIDAINKDQVFRFVKKPWTDLHFKTEIRQAIQYFHMTLELNALEKKCAGSVIENHDERFKGALEMAGAVCHEFSQPLQVISGYCELLMETPENNCPKDIIAMIHSQVIRLGDLLQKVMHFDAYQTCYYANNTRIIDLHHSGQQ
ncbi:response regulator [uncultured Desulfobacter sp.]|uniref:response regulator n=1 Tax=uncultured Desulfobacter sp. TaxID=240139 RepID=UPI002AABB991|nr:response regulator [uncultured Desulfobacter sp.]